MSKLNMFLSAIAVATLVLVGLYASNLQPREVQGSVVRSGEYHATSTPTSNGTRSTAGLLEIATSTLGVSGTLGSVIITGTSSGAFAFYDATTTILGAGGRDVSMSTSSITLASFPAGALPGTYTFDVIFTKGLIAVFTGTIGSTTITWR